MQTIFEPILDRNRPGMETYVVQSTVKESFISIRP